MSRQTHAPSSSSSGFHKVKSAPIVRYLVRHTHPASVLPDGSTAPAADVVIGYSAALKEAMSYAISTASRYQGIIYGDDGSGGPYSFIRSFKPGRASG